jgi:hypothetical protein
MINPGTPRARLFKTEVFGKFGYQICEQRVEE